ncbi:hypothetical protein JYT74_00310 [Crocinitomix catalasitica]|nr:hypothetical protein [Crocinitomix catalasitica]
MERRYLLIGALFYLIACSGDQQEEIEDRPENMSESTTEEVLEIFVNDEAYYVDSLYAQKYDFFGHPLFQIDLYISASYGNGDMTVLTVKSTAMEGVNLFLPIEGDTSQASMIFMRESSQGDEYPSEFFMPNLQLVENVGGTTISNLTSESFDIKFEGTLSDIRVLGEGVEALDDISVNGIIYGVFYVETKFTTPAPTP